jgi:uncharacterized protein involved in cysteine biosynthesis
MILSDFLKALSQLGSDRRFRSVFWRGVGITLGLLVAVFVLVVWGVGFVVGDTVTLPWIGAVGWIDNALSLAAIPLMLVLSIFLMVPVASAVIGIFLEEVAGAVEDRHYPALGPADPIPFADGLVDAVSFLGVLILANIAAFALYLVFTPLAPIIFWLLNGFLLGREYFTVVALRRVGRTEAKAQRKRHAARIWLAGTLMAIPLTVPIVNLLIPILGVATFTHLYHRLER